MIRILVADDHAVVRRGLRQLFAEEPDMEVVGEAADGSEAIRLVEALQPDVVLLDLLMPSSPGVEALPELRRLAPAARIVVLSASLDDAHVLPAITGGAVSYLLKDIEPLALVSAVRAAARGETTISPEVSARVVKELTRMSGTRAKQDLLTARELAVLDSMVRGHSNRRIAASLHVSEETVKTHVSHILAKLNVADRTQAAVHAIRTGLVPGITTSKT